MPAEKRIGRPRTCNCGACYKCIRRVRQSQKRRAMRVPRRRAVKGKRPGERVVYAATLMPCVGLKPLEDDPRKVAAIEEIMKGYKWHDSTD